MRGIALVGMDGLVVLKQLKQMEKKIPVIITSGIQDENTIQSAMQLGAVKYFKKPYQLSNLEAFICFVVAGVGNNAQ